jgi:hypothetical protein
MLPMHEVCDKIRPLVLADAFMEPKKQPKPPSAPPAS